MVLSLTVFGIAVALAGGFALLAWLRVRRRADLPGPGANRCRDCRGAGSIGGADTPSGYRMCQTCDGTGWVRT